MESEKKTGFSLQKTICNGDPVFFLAGMPGKELKMEKKINRGVIRTGETDMLCPNRITLHPKQP